MMLDELVVAAAGIGPSVGVATGLALLGPIAFVGFRVFARSREFGRPVWWAVTVGVVAAAWFPLTLFWWWINPRAPRSTKTRARSTNRGPTL